MKMGESEDEILKGNFQGKTAFGNPRKFASICDSARERQANLTMIEITRFELDVSTKESFRTGYDSRSLR